MICGCAGLIWSDHGTGYPLIITEQTLLGAGLGLLVPPMTGALMASVERSRSGVASGALTTMRQTGSMIGVALFGTLIAGRGGFYTGLHTALLISIAVLTAGAWLAHATRAAASRAAGDHGKAPGRPCSAPEG
jgi:DHA2 family methylenomycin A resistance protein-like MFS transporter